MIASVSIRRRAVGNKFGDNSADQTSNDGRNLMERSTCSKPNTRFKGEITVKLNNRENFVSQPPYISLMRHRK